MNKNPYSSDDLRWQAVLARERAADGHFVTAVKSTGIYCRPSCPARHPARERVRFYPDAPTAQKAGFRPCKRCRPDQPIDAHSKLAAEAAQLLRDTHQPLSLGELADKLGVSPYHLQRIFKSETGLSPRQFAAGLRAEKLRQGLRDGSDVTSALYDAGYQSPAPLYAEAQPRLGMQPSQYRSGGSGKQIRFCVSPCPLGWLLLARTEKGVCAVRLGDDPQRMIEALEREFPAASLVAEGEPDPATRAVLDWLEDKPASLNLPLDLRASAFQLRVWEELRRIPKGQTRTYAEVAEAIGKPKAVRAVAGACAANPAAIITPCHRVVRSDGGLGGYRWGIDRKKRLLEAEKAAVIG